MAKTGSELCPCGSGKKYKHCCMGKDELSRKQGMTQDMFDEIRKEMAGRDFDCFFVELKPAPQRLLSL